MELLYLDPGMVVCRKEPGMDSEKDVPEALKEQLGGEVFPIHRLDKGVGGLMVYARTKPAAAFLSKAVTDGALEKEYLALVHGCPPIDGTWQDLLWKDSRKNKVFVVKRPRAGVREAKLSYRTLAETDKLTLVRVRLFTGRTHQIRVQFSSLGLPLLGDIRYGSKDANCSTALWSYRLALIHPITGERIDVTQPPPEQYPWNLFNCDELRG